MPGYTPRNIGSAAAGPSGVGTQYWDPYPQYVLETEIFDGDGKVTLARLPDLSQAYGDTPNVVAAVANAAEALAIATDLQGDVAVSRIASDLAASAATGAEVAAVTAQGLAQLARNDALTAASGVNAQIDTRLGGNAYQLLQPDGMVRRTRLPSATGQVVTGASALVDPGTKHYWVFDATGATGVLPLPGDVSPWVDVVVKNVNLSSLTVASTAASGTFSQIDGSDTVSLAQWQTVRIFSDGTRWLTA